MLCLLLALLVDFFLQGDVADYGKDDFFDPLRRHDVKADASSKDLPDEVKSLKSLSEVSPHLSEKEWTSFRNFLMKRFPISRMISISSVSKPSSIFLQLRT